MNQIIDKIVELNSYINQVVWGVPMLVLIISTGIYMSVKTGFFQFRNVKHIAKETIVAIFRNKSITNTKDKKAISQFQSISTVLAATIGTGNIAGVATAIALGGPGAVFWMWISALFGMMTNFSENVLGIYYRKRNKNGEWSGGAMYYLENGLKDKKGAKKYAKPLSILFSFFCVFASFGIGNMMQVNSIASAMESSFSIPVAATGIVLASVTAIVIVGGIKRIGKVTERLVPIMALLYILGALYIMLKNFRQIPYVFSSIFSNAFSLGSIGGGVGGHAIKRAVTMGFKRGIFSNEAGLGSTVMVNSASDVKEPVIQGMWGIFEVFFDTILICTLTAFLLLSSTTNAVSMEKALSNISTKTEYFHIYEGESSAGEIALIDDVANETIKLATEKTSQKDLGIPIKVRTIYGQEFLVDVIRQDKKTENDYLYSNIMAVKGIAKRDSNGKISNDSNGNPIIKSVEIKPVNGVPLVNYAFLQAFGKTGEKFLSIAILLFAYSTVIGWSYYGTKAMEYIFGIKSTVVYKALFVFVILIGSTIELQLAWDISDTLNAMMAIPNLIGLLLLSSTVVKITQNYNDRKIKKKLPHIKPLYSAYSEIQKEHEKE